MRINYSDEEVVKGEKSIFLAGPTPRNKVYQSWRSAACQMLEDVGFDGVVYVPEYSNGEPKEDYVDQANWEYEALSEATVILFWIPRELPEMPGFTTNVEFGYWVSSGKAVYGRPDYAQKVRYLDWLYEKVTNEQPFSSLENLLFEGIYRANREERKLILSESKNREK